VTSRGEARPFTRFRDGWILGPERPVIEPNEVHVWRIPLGGLTAAADVGSGLLPDELRRASAFVRRIDGARWARSRLALRGILARYLGVAPSHVAFERGSRGKPRAAGADFEYNLTHSSDLAVCAVGPMALGVDLERIREAPMAAGVAAGIVSPEGPIRPNEGGSAELDWAFFEAWTRVEATLKATGEGLSAIDLRPPEWIRALARSVPTEVDGRPLQLIDLPLDEGFVGALAVLDAGALDAVRCWSWAI
jgi:4'-phosphopantetheinyl transferase